MRIWNDKIITMTDENLFLEHQHSLTRRFAVLDDDGTSAWLYITEPDSRKPFGDVWVYNRIAAPPTEAIKSYRGGPPPAAQGFASDDALCSEPMKQEWSFLWSPDGESVAILKNDAPVACIVAGMKRGYCRELIKDGPWGQPWSDKVYRETFDSGKTP
jgi:hypothetical protein